MHPYRTHNCGELRPDSVGERVRLSGWIHQKRDHGGVLFIDLRDHYGITQVVVPQSSELSGPAGRLPKETAVRFDGILQLRPKGLENPKLATGEVEVSATEYEVLGASDPLPFEIAADALISEETRLRYRFLDLRRARLHRNILFRSQIIASIRRHMTALGFNELQTPILTSSSPEGARDYLVPARLHPGKFYALPQAPQQFKQLLMVAGFDRYFQIAPCFRDEAARADRSPGEFYQLDLEMSFATQDDVFDSVEKVLSAVFDEFSDWEATPPPYPRIPYREAMRKYGTDKPDLRNPLQIDDVSDLFAGTAFQAFADKTVRVLPVPGTQGRSRSWFDKIVAWAKSNGASDLLWGKVGDDGKVSGRAQRLLGDEPVESIVRRVRAKPGTTLLFYADRSAKLVETVLGRLRDWLASELDLLEKNTFRFCWITDFPMFERDAESGAVVFSHNPFSMPQGGMEALLHKDPLEINAWQYDIVCNGYELSSGAVRNHDPEVMYKAFEIAGYNRSVVDEKFPALQQAFRFGAPPHAGIAPGIDRIVMLLAAEPNIREVIAFPMNQRAQDLLMGAPSRVATRQLQELRIKVDEDG